MSFTAPLLIPAWIPADRNPAGISADSVISVVVMSYLYSGGAPPHFKACCACENQKLYKQKAPKASRHSGLFEPFL
jgi:hypothetical protein